jgi:transglutaminase-like putative cysteine protease
MTYPGHSVDLDIYQSPQSSYMIQRTSTDAGMTFTTVETVPGEVWNATVLAPSNQMATHGFVADDFKQGQLDYKMELSAAAQPYSNYHQYFEIRNRLADGKTYFIHSQYPQSLPQSLAMDASVDAEGAKYLRGSRYIQLDQVQSIAKNLAGSIKGKTRLEAALEIIQAMPKIIDYDSTKVALDSVTILTTREIKKAGKGVCQHYAALFTAIARSLGLPTRMVAGLSFDEQGVWGHEWVEIELTPGVWWPLEPQIHSWVLIGHNYVPINVDQTYDVQIGESDWNAYSAQDNAVAPFLSVTISKFVNSEATR